MPSPRKLTALLLAGALATGLAAPVQAGKSDRAAQAIAAAQAKIESARTVGAGTELPRQIAAAQAELARASEAKQSGHNEAAIQIAIHAGAMADAALGESQKRKDVNAAVGQAVARDQVMSAQQQADAARAEAAQANARAADAQNAAAISAQQAAAAQTAAATVAATPPAPPTKVETTVTTSSPARTVSKRRVVKKRVVTRHRAPVRTVTTATTRVTTGQ